MLTVILLPRRTTCAECRRLTSQRPLADDERDPALLDVVDRVPGGIDVCVRHVAVDVLAAAERVVPARAQATEPDCAAGKQRCTVRTAMGEANRSDPGCSGHGTASFASSAAIGRVESVDCAQCLAGDGEADRYVADGQHSSKHVNAAGAHSGVQVLEGS